MSCRLCLGLPRELHSWAAASLPTGLWEHRPALPSLSHNRAVTMTFPLLPSRLSSEASIPKLHFSENKTQQHLQRLLPLLHVRSRPKAFTEF